MINKRFFCNEKENNWIRWIVTILNQKLFNIYSLSNWSNILASCILAPEERKNRLQHVWWNSLFSFCRCGCVWCNACLFDCEHGDKLFIGPYLFLIFYSVSSLVELDGSDPNIFNPMNFVIIYFCPKLWSSIECPSELPSRTDSSDAILSLNVAGGRRIL